MMEQGVMVRLRCLRPDGESPSAEWVVPFVPMGGDDLELPGVGRNVMCFIQRRSLLIDGEVDLWIGCADETVDLERVLEKCQAAVGGVVKKMQGPQVLRVGTPIRNWRGRSRDGDGTLIRVRWKLDGSAEGEPPEAGDDVFIVDGMDTRIRGTVHAVHDRSEHPHPHLSIEVEADWRTLAG